MLSQSRNVAPASTASTASADRGHLDLDRHVRERRADPPVRRGDAAGRQLVVVLDHGDVVEAHALVGAAAGPDRVLLQGPQARAWSCGCPAPCALVPASASAQRAGVGGDAGHAGRAGSARCARRSAATRVGPVTVASTSPRTTRAPSRRLRPTPRRSAGDGRRRPRRRRPARPPRPSARATRSAVSVWSAGMVATLVTSTRSGPPRSSVRARSTIRATATGSSPTVAQRRPSVGPESRRLPRLASACRCAVRPARRWPRHSSPASGKSSRQWQPRVSCARVGGADQRAGHGEQVGRLPGGGAGGGPVRAELGQGLRRPGQRLGAAQHAGAARSWPAAAARRDAGSTTQPAPVGAGQPGRPGRAGRAAMSSAIRRAKTSPSSSELEASRLAPCTPVQATSPQA